MREAQWVSDPMEDAGALKMRKTPKQVSHIFTAPWKTRRREHAAASFPHLPQGLLRGYFRVELDRSKVFGSAASIL